MIDEDHELAPEDRALLEAERADDRDELEDELASAGGEQDELRREAPSRVLAIAVMLLLFLLAAIGGLRGRLAGERAAERPRLAPKGALAAVLDGPTTTPVGAPGAALAGDPAAGGVDAPGSVPAPAVEGVDPLFATYYAEHGGLRLFGLPLSAALEVNGRRVQWFERARLEHWPEHAGTRYAIQPGLVGREYTDAQDFPRQAFFTNRPGLIFFPETSHGLGGLFLDFWTAHGGLDLFGYPISDELSEVLDDGRTRRVQYFERARMEAHPRSDGGGEDVLLGLLGRALYLRQPRPEPLPLPAPTPVPLP